jgi:molybdopterin synthase sulfur carrier subunit
MSIPVRIPTPLRKLTSDQEVVAAEGTTVREVINDLDKHYPGLKDRICDEKDNVRRFVNVFVNDEDIRFLNESETSLKAGDEISIVPAIAGG